MLTVNRTNVFGDMEILRNHFKGILNDLCENYMFADAFADHETPGGVRYDCDMLDQAAEDRGYWFSSGATRMIIGDDDKEFIIKFQPYEDSRGHDYCNLELLAYKAAVQAGYDELFCPIEYLFDYHFGDRVCGIYVMPYCHCCEDTLENESYKYQYERFCSDNGYDEDDEDSRDEFDYDYDTDCSFIELALHDWGRESEGEAFCDFLRDCGCNDLHAGNWGYFENKIVLVDYAGYGTRSCDF